MCKKFTGEFNTVTLWSGTNTTVQHSVKLLLPPSIVGKLYNTNGAKKDFEKVTLRPNKLIINNVIKKKKDYVTHIIPGKLIHE